MWIAVALIALLLTEDPKPAATWSSEDGMLEVDTIYEGDFKFATDTNEWEPVKRLPLMRHHCARINWLNPEEFPQLEPPADDAEAMAREGSEPIRIRFKVISRDIQRMEEFRWSVSYECRILRIE